jgi:hypothetical protein
MCQEIRKSAVLGNGSNFIRTTNCTIRSSVGFAKVFLLKVTSAEKQHFIYAFSPNYQRNHQTAKNTVLTTIKKGTLNFKVVSEKEG